MPLAEPVPREAVRQAVVFMRDQLERPVTVAELAGVAGFSPYHFLRVFKRATGHTPHRYLTLLRVAEVKRLLEGGATVTQAAERCGFYSTAHLSAVFLRETGVRPSQWSPRTSDRRSA
ncbi:AraC family transcriptional regulator [Amycolatopsis sp. NBC_00345]|uniref:AraC family transcriptional regulator n=1 Tax=Amycolatopsis sp. NBC_00345 TaxID=2975955 RepID=UPI002E2657F0